MRPELKDKYKHAIYGIATGMIYMICGIVFMVADMNISLGIIMFISGAIISGYYSYKLNHIESLNDYLFFKDIQDQAKDLMEAKRKQDIDDWNKSVEKERQREEEKDTSL